MILAKSREMYFVENENLLLKVLQINVKVSWNSTVESWISYKMQWDLWIVVKINWIVK